MKTFLLFSLLVCASACADAGQRSASIEDSDLRPLSMGINTAVVRDQSFLVFKKLRCDIRGKEIGLSRQNSRKIWFVTTADGCGWGAALGPIWVVEENSAKMASMLLASGGYGLSARRHRHNGLDDIAISYGGAEGEISKTYIFDGYFYKLDKK